eukprot:gene20678-biopygen11621
MFQVCLEIVRFFPTCGASHTTTYRTYGYGGGGGATDAAAAAASLLRPVSLYVVVMPPADCLPPEKNGSGRGPDAGAR